MSRTGTVDKVVIILAIMVASTVFVTVIAIAVSKILHPEVNATFASEAVVNIITTVMGALVGFIGGRAYGRSEANGNGNKPV